MSTVSDLTGVAALAGAGFVGYQIWKNKDAIGGFFGGIQSGVDDLTKAIGNVGSSFQSAGEQTVKVVVDLQNSGKSVLEDTGLVTPGAPEIVQTLETVNNGAGLTGPKIVSNTVSDAIIENTEIDEAFTSAVETLQEKAVPTTSTNVGTTLLADWISDKLGIKSSSSSSVSSSYSQGVTDPEYIAAMERIQALVDSGYKSPSSGDETKTGKIKTTSEFEDKGIGKLFNLLGFKKITYT